MGRTKFCRICRTENNLKYTTKELRQLNKKQLLLAQGAQQGQTNNRASKKLLLTTPTLGNICQVCDERIQIFHRLDDGGHESSSDVEIEVDKTISESIPIRFAENLTSGDFLQRTQRPETPVIVDDDDMLFNIFMQKVDQKTQLPRHQINSSQQHLDKQFANQFHSSYTPPQSTAGSSEGDESKVIEVLNSRESTPAPIHPLPAISSSTNIVDSQGHRIVAVIELDDGDDNDNDQHHVNDIENQSDLCITIPSSPTEDLSCSEQAEPRSVLPPNESSNLNMNETCQSNVVEDDDEIVFCKVDNDNEKIPVLRKRKRKSYDEKELRLVASLNLVSSDSEGEDSPAKVGMSKNLIIDVTEPSTLVVNKTFNCNVCQLKFPDSESLSVHERIHQGVKCILCTFAFQQVKRLIHHMRRKHREYNGDTLSEKPRSGQDSCMTIRLRYMQRTTFYECQLCGRIDDVFREHKEHIIDKHPNESKSLKDPIMKQLKCLVCKAKCGSQYLSLCRHLINSHEYQEYKSNLRELVHVSAFGWNAARHEEVAKTAKIYQFVKRKTFFFECKICSKVVAGYLHHLRHVKQHQKSVNNGIKAKVAAFEETFPGKKSSSVVSLRVSNLDKFCTSLKKDGVCISNNLRKRDKSAKKELKLSQPNLKNKSKKIEKVIKITSKVEKTKVKDAQKSKFNTYQSGIGKKTIKTVQSEKSQVETIRESGKKLNNKCKPKHKKVVKLPNDFQLTKGKSKNKINKNDKLFKVKSKETDLKTQPKKKKVKPNIRQVDLQKYKCNYCVEEFKGFRLFNLHLLRQHKENEYAECNKCNKVYTSFSKFEEHTKQCPVPHTSKQKRKFLKKSLLSENVSFQPYVKKVPKKNDDVASGYLQDNYNWLKELLKLKKPLSLNDRNLTHKSPQTAFFYLQCCYCLHLFANDQALKEHKEEHHCKNSNILLRYKPLKKT